MKKDEENYLLWRKRWGWMLLVVVVTILTISTKAEAKLEPVTNVQKTKYSTQATKLSWNESEGARFYHIYMAKKKYGNYKLAGTTKKTTFLVDHLKKDTDYYFYITAGPRKAITEEESEPSKKIHTRTKTFSRKTIFAGDSITQGWTVYSSFPYMEIGGTKKTVAAVGLNAVTFRTKRVFSGKSALQKLISEKAYRVYITMGTNEIHYRKYQDVIQDYEDLLKTIQAEIPNTDIVLCAISPVTKKEEKAKPGFSQIPKYNKELKKLAEKLEISFFDGTGFMKDSSGHMKAKYAAGDGYHWQRETYKEYAKRVTKYDLSLDR